MTRNTLILLLCCGAMSAPALATDEASGDRLFKRLDSDNNGVVSEQEYLSSAEQRARRAFKRLDSNGDGQISQSEYDTAVRKIKEYIEKRRQQRLTPNNSNE